MIVIKFGGSLLKDAESILRCAAEVSAQAGRSPVVVVSALNGVTDILIENAARALAAKADPSDLRRLHFGILKDLGLEAQTVERMLFDVEVLLRGIQQVGELSVRVFDRLLSYGERMSSVIFTQVLRKVGLPAYSVCSYDIGFLTDSKHTEAEPLPDIEKNLRQNIQRVGGIPVVTGFIAKDRQGNITTIGRNGSDLTASVLACALDAEELQIYTHTDGLMSADPKVVKDAVMVSHLTYQEAAELAYFGATVLHPKTLLSVTSKRIPVRLRPLANTKKETLISSRKSSEVPILTYRSPVALVNIHTHRLSPILNDLGSLSALFGQAGLKPIAITNTLSTFTAVVEEEPFRKKSDYRVSGSWVEFPRQKGEALEEQFRFFREGLTEKANAEIRRGCALVCAVSESLKEQKGILKTVLQVIEGAKAAVHIFSTTSSAIALMTAVDKDDVAAVLTKLHRFFLTRKHSLKR
ncbi:MAG: aspartate kinase [Planctomycetota bacterium]|nr:aspartate kinase [Planctomycetota bacterium]